jgi:glucuronosyltransferase
MLEDDHRAEQRTTLERMTLKLWLVIFFVFSASTSNAARILAIFSIGSKSHFISALPIVEALAEKGHVVTLLSPFQLKKSSTRQVYVKEWADLMEEYKMDFFAMHKENSFTQMATLFIQWSSINEIMYDSLMNHPEIQNVIKERNVDLLLIDGYSELPLPLADLLQVPVVGHYSSAGLMGLFNKMGISSDFASIPAGLTDYTDDMNFLQRVANTISAKIFTAVMDYFFTGAIDKIHKRNYPNARSVFDMAKYMSLVLVNSHPTTAWQRSLPPNVIPVGSVHTRPANPREQVITYRIFLNK